MRALQLVAPHTIEVREIDIPRIAPDEVLIKVAGAGLCHSDLHVLHRDNLPWSRPLTLGHETSGHVAQIGADVRDIRDGDPVLVSLIWACGRCRPCIEERDNVCVNAAGRNSFPVAPGIGPDGGMAEYMAVKGRYLFPLGGLDPVPAAPLADAGLTSMHAINGARHRLGPGATAVVIGIGGLGQMAVQILGATTAAGIVAIDIDPAKLTAAQAVGAIALPGDASAGQAVLDLTSGYGADAVFDFVGAQHTVDLACRIIAPDGVLRFVGLGGGSLTYAANSDASVLPWGVEVRRSFGGTRTDQRQVLDLARAGALSIPVQTYTLDTVHQAFADLEAGRVAGRAVIVPSGDTGAR